MLIRLNKYLADCGVASRRKADQLISRGLVRVNHQAVKELGVKIDPRQDIVAVNGRPIKPQKFIYIQLNKPVGYTCSTRKFPGEKNILDLVNIDEKIFPVGRLDKDSRGLIFLTNDGDWANKISHPRFGLEKEYQVQIDKKINRRDLDQMVKGIRDENENLRLKQYQIKTPQLINIILTQGHKREIRRLFSRFGYNVTDLKRIRIGHWRLPNLPEGAWRFFEPAFRHLKI